MRITFLKWEVVLDTTKVQIFKQITTLDVVEHKLLGCFRYHKGTDFQANHNCVIVAAVAIEVVLDTTKVQIFKQITTTLPNPTSALVLF